MSGYGLTADAVVILHLGYVLFVVLALPVVWVGALRRVGWGWVRNFWFRVVHLLMIAVVAIQALVGVICPLTTLEAWLRGEAGQTVAEGTFMGRLANDLLFFQTAPWVFTLSYCLFGLAVLLTLIFIRPARPKRFPRKVA